MTGWSPRRWVLGGFVISLGSVVLNTFVLSSLNGRLSEVSSEQAAVRESLSRMAEQVQAAESKYELARVFHWVSLQVPEKQREAARQEAAYQLIAYFTRTYAAGRDISAVEVVKTERIELEDDYAAIIKLADLQKQIGAAKSDKERDRLLAEVDKVDVDSTMVPKTELGKQFAELAKLADSEVDAEDESDLLLAIAPTLQTLRGDFVKAHDEKTKRLAFLDARKRQLQNYQQLASYLAIGMQLLGLFFILSRDVVKDINDSKKS